MPANSVYQPTTVSFEANGGGLLQTNSSSRLKILRKPIYQLSLLILGLIFFVFGILLVAIGSLDYVDTEEHKTADSESDSPSIQEEESKDLVGIIGGVFLLIISFVLLGKSIFQFSFVFGN